MPACQISTENTDNFKTIKIQLDTDSSKIILTGLDYNIIESLKNDTLNTEEWQSLFAVYVKPTGAAESQSEPISGTYSISNRTIVFLPDTAFARSFTYEAVFTYPQYFSKSSAFSSKSLPGRLATIENQFDF